MNRRSRHSSRVAPRFQESASLFLTSLTGGGAERAMVLLAAGLADRGWSVDLILTRAQGVFVRDVPEHVRVVDLGASRIIWSLPRLVRYLRRERPPVLLSTLSTTNCVAILARYLARTHTRVVVNEQNTPSKSHANSHYMRLRTLPKLMRWTYPRADAVTAISGGVARDLAHVTGLADRRISVIYNPVVSGEVESLATQPVDHPWFRPAQPPVILGVGRLVDQKDFSTLLRAFARVRAATDVRLIILGDGERRKQLQILAEELGIADHVSFPGFATNPYAYMARSAVLALSSKWEGLGMVLIEAMTCGTPVVSTDCPSGPDEILEGGRWGRLAAVASAEDLADAILSTMRDSGPDPRARAADFSVDRAVEQYEQVLRSAR